MNVTLIRIDAADAAGGALPVRLASHDMPEACHLNGEEWEPALANLPDFALDFFGGGFAGQVTAPRTSFSVATMGLAGFAAAPSARARFADARVRVWHGDITSAATADLGPLTLRFDGRITGEPDVDNAARVARFDAAVQDGWADKPLLPLFAGTGGIEGPADLTGQPKPLVLGNARFCGGVLIDSTDNVWMVSNGAVQAVNAVYDRLASLGTSAGNFADLAALKAASIPNGSWGTCLAQGLVRLGAPPDGRVSFDVSGSNSGTGGYVRLPGAIIRRIADLAGGTVNAASLTALDSARPYNLALQLREQTTARDVIAQIADSVAAVAGVSLTGQLFAQALTIGGSGEALNADDTSAQRVVSVEELAKAAPNWRLATEAELTFEVHSAEEAAFEYRWQGEYSAARVYRLDDVVTGPDGAAWQYINAAPAAGQALPVWPATSNTYWALFQAPASASIAPADSNRVPFSRMEGDKGWVVFYNPSARPITSSFGLQNGFRCFQATMTASAAGQEFAYFSDRFAVNGGERLSVQARLLVAGTAPGNWRIDLISFDKDGNAFFQNPFVSAGAAAFGLFSTFLTVPAGAVSAYLQFVAGSNGAGTVQALLAAPMVATAAAGQTVHPSFSPGPNASDGADPNNLITITDGRIDGIGDGDGTPVANDLVLIRDLFSNLPGTGEFVGQQFFATDTRAELAWTGSAWAPQADLTLAINGPADLTLDYTNDLTLTSPLPVTGAYQLVVAGGSALTSGVTWAVSVVSGTFAGTAPSIVGAGGGQLRINSAMTSAMAELRVTATVGGRTYPPFTVKISRNVAPPGLGGGVTVSGSLTSISSSSFARMHANDLSITLPSGVTTATLVASGDLLIDPVTPTGDTVVEAKWQRESSPGTWVDVGSVATSSPSPNVFNTGEVDPGVGGGTPIYAALPGSISCNRSATGLSAGSAQKFRLVARVSSGNVRTVTGSGSVSASA